MYTSLRSLGLLATAYALVGSALLGCASDSTEPAPESGLLHVVGTDGAALTSWVAVVTSGSGSEVFACPDATEVRCAAEGLRLPAGTTVWVKSPGYAFAGGPGEAAELRLTPLEASTSNADYVTGFGADGLEAFVAMGYPADSDLGKAYAVKFYIAGLDTAAPTVYFQNTKKHPIHYDFAHDVLGVTGTSSEFSKQTYQAADRKAMAGTLVYYRDLTAEDGLTAPIALTFFPSDTLTPTQAQRAHRLIEERLGLAPRTGDKLRLVYVPAGVTQETAMDTAAAASFAEQDVRWVTSVALHGAQTMQAMNPGIAYGMLRRLTPEQLLTTIVSSTDIIVMPRLPNDLPLVGGTITEELQTPLAHVNIAAHARGTPNLALPGASTDPRVQPLLDKLVRFEVKGGTFTLAETTLAEAEAFWTTQQRPRYVPEHDDTFDTIASFADLGFADSNKIGVKAANLAELSHFMGGVTPDGFAIPFHFYDAYMTENHVSAAICTAAYDDCVSESRTAEACTPGKTLCEATVAANGTFWDHADRLLAAPDLALDAAAREAALDGLALMIKNGTLDPTFGAALDAKVTALVGTSKVRLRSSTNSEDLPNFSGAGLYESHSATGTGAKAASIVIRTVWASVWRWRAFEERRFWNIDHRAVRMGIAVHRSFPDEAANGVLITQNFVDPLTAGMYLNVQQGEVSVTNPEGGEVAEAASLVPSPGGGVQVQTRHFSSLSPGASLLTPAEVLAVYQAAMKIQLHFAPLYEVDPSVLALDIEFKLDGPARALAIKQVRPFTVGN
jgi:pyruvate,water dikinase